MRVPPAASKHQTLMRSQQSNICLSARRRRLIVPEASHKAQERPARARDRGLCVLPAAREGVRFTNCRRLAPFTAAGQIVTRPSAGAQSRAGASRTRCVVGSVACSFRPHGGAALRPALTSRDGTSWPDCVREGLEFTRSPTLARRALLQVDRLLLHDVTGGVACENSGAGHARLPVPGQVFSIIDHLLVTGPKCAARRLDPRRADDRGVAQGSRELGSAHRRRKTPAGYHPRDRARARHRIAGPDDRLRGQPYVHAGRDRRLGLGHRHVGRHSRLATQTLAQTRPKTMRVTFEGPLPPRVSAKDMVLRLIGELGAGGRQRHRGRIRRVEAPRLQSKRASRCATWRRLQAKYGFVPPDEATTNTFRTRVLATRESLGRRGRLLAGASQRRRCAFDREVHVDARRWRRRSRGAPVRSM